MIRTYYATRVSHLMVVQEEFRKTQFVVVLIQTYERVKHGRKSHVDKKLFSKRVNYGATLINIIPIALIEGGAVLGSGGTQPGSKVV